MFKLTQGWIHLGGSELELGEQVLQYEDWHVEHGPAAVSGQELEGLERGPVIFPLDEEAVGNVLAVDELDDLAEDGGVVGRPHLRQIGVPGVHPSTHSKAVWENKNLCKHTLG